MARTSKEWKTVALALIETRDRLETENLALQRVLRKIGRMGKEGPACAALARATLRDL
jgi:hypothetical protein